MARPPRHLYLVRHAKAEEEHGGGDGHRSLTVEGRRQMREHADRLSERVRLERLVTSPLVRATQTAEIVSTAWGVDEILVRSDLAYGPATARTVADLAAALGPGHALVGHNPSLAEGLAAILGLTEVPRLRKGGVVALVREGHVWSLDWVSAPGRRLARSL